MIKVLFFRVFICVSCLLSANRTNAQIPIIEIIRQAVIKAIKVADLAVQRLQNKTIWLQQAQETLENVLEKAKLTEISDWVDKQKTLYADYFEELNNVKTAITTYHRVKEIIELQAKLVAEYKRAYHLFKNDSHFTAPEIEYMEQVYAGILEESIKNMSQMELVVKAFATQMGDAQRLAIINAAAAEVSQNYSDLQAFNNQNKILSLQRSRNQEEMEQVKAMYGIE
jgi:hypothetical protein